MGQPAKTLKNPARPDERRVLEDRALQIGMMFRLSRSTRLQPYLLLIALFVMFWEQSEWWEPLVLTLIYSLGTWAFDKLRAAYVAADPPPEAADIWGRRFAWCSLLSGSCWGLAGFLYFTPDSAPHQTFLALTMLGISTSAVMSRAGYLPAFYAYTMAVMLPLIVRSFISGDPLDVGAGVLGMIYYAGISLWAHTFSREQRDNIALRHENVELVAQLQQALNNAEEARRVAEAAGQAKTEFLATISHELRTPLNGIIGMTGLLLGAGLNPRQKSFAETVRRSGEALLGIINDILDFSKLEADRVTLERIDFDLRELVHGAVELMAPRAHDKGLEIDVVFGPGAPEVVLGDPARLRQVLLNLVGNAVKFTEAGAILCEVERGGERDGERDGLALVRIAVSDTGMGVPPEAVPNLFSRFTQGDASITRRFGGTGLGLAIAKRLVEAMGGEIGHDALATGGSRFWFVAPLPEIATATPRQATLAGYRIAVVAPDGASEVLRRKLQNLGAEVLRPPAEAAAVLAAAPDTVIHDARDNDAASVALARAILAAGAPPPRQVIALWTAANIADDDNPFTARLAKPYRLSALVEALSAPPARQPVATRTPVQGRGMNILVADDLEVNRQLLSLMLEEAGHRVQTATDGDEALAMARTGQWDLIFMDLEMPRLHGIAAAAAIRGLPGAAGRVPIVAVTAHESADHLERCRGAGMVDIIAKPIEPAQLSQMLARWRRGPAEALPAVNKGMLADLERRVGAAKTAELIGDLLADLDRRVVRFMPLAESADWAALRREGHILKGLSGNFGLPELAELADRLLAAARAGDAAGTTSLAAAIVQAHAGAVAELAPLTIARAN